MDCRKAPSFGKSRKSMLPIATRSAGFEVALFASIRANGQAIYLAQPTGLGFEATKTTRAESPSNCIALRG